MRRAAKTGNKRRDGRPKASKKRGRTRKSLKLRNLSSYEEEVEQNFHEIGK